MNVLPKNWQQWQKNQASGGNLTTTQQQERELTIQREEIEALSRHLVELESNAPRPGSNGSRLPKGQESAPVQSNATMLPGSVAPQVQEQSVPDTPNRDTSPSPEPSMSTNGPGISTNLGESSSAPVASGDAPPMGDDDAVEAGAEGDEDDLDNFGEDDDLDEPPDDAA